MDAGEVPAQLLLGPSPALISAPGAGSPQAASCPLWPCLRVSQAGSFLLPLEGGVEDLLVPPLPTSRGGLVSLRGRRCLSPPSPTPGHSLFSETRWGSVSPPSHLFPLHLWSLWPFLPRFLPQASQHVSP